MENDQLIDDPKVKTLDRAIRTAFILLVLVVIGFGAYYYLDRYAYSSTPLVDRNVEKQEAAALDDPQNFNTRMQLANAYAMRGLVDQAIEQYQAALVLRPSSTDAMLGEAMLYAGKNDDAALPLLEKVIAVRKEGEFAAVDTRLATAYYLLASIQYRRQQYDLAVENALASSNISKTDADTRLVLANSYRALGKNDEAIEQYNEAILFVPEFTEAYQGLEACYRDAGRDKEARWAGAMAELSSGKYSEAAARLEQLANEAPGMKEVRWGLGMAYARLKEDEKAAAAFRAALAIDPDYQPAKDGLARLKISQ